MKEKIKDQKKREQVKANHDVWTEQMNITQEKKFRFR